MSSTQARSASSTHGPGPDVATMRLEVVLVPVSDVDRAKRFYESLGWRLDADFPVTDDFRVVQLTPPGSGCSIIFGSSLTGAVPGSVEGLQLVVADLAATREALIDRGVDVSEVFHDETGVFHHAGTDARVTGPAPERGSYGSWMSFSDPDGNGWLVQEVTTRLPGRVVPQTTYESAADLAEALRRAAAAHGEHEARTGEEDADWPDWYAEHMVRERAGEALPA
jgi:catechol 2,3-dioxygenase-like lactoylglutathione lyase family enzyme